MELSIVIPLLNEAESLSELHQWITKSLDVVIKDYELIFIDDGSQDNSWEVINQLASQDKRVKGLRFLKNF